MAIFIREVLEVNASISMSHGKESEHFSRLQHDSYTYLDALITSSPAVL